MGLLYSLLVLSALLGATSARAVVGITIHSYLNPNGTAYQENTSQRKCCDGPQRLNCSTGDTCDTYFDICVGKIIEEKDCEGAYFQTSTLRDTNSIQGVSEMMAVADTWTKDATVLVFIRDDDTQGSVERHDHIDTLTQMLDITPGSQEFLSQTRQIDWVGPISMRIAVRVWCSNDYFSSDCSAHCVGLHPVARCDQTTGQLICTDYSDDLLIEFQRAITEIEEKAIEAGLLRFCQQLVCRSPNNTLFQFPDLDARSNTLSFSLYCGDREVTPLEFESVLMLHSDNELFNYLNISIVRSLEVLPQGYGQHVAPNVYVGVEILDVDHTTGTSYAGSDLSSTRRCCDQLTSKDCSSGDICDLTFSVCIGTMQNGACVGAYMQSAMYNNTLSLHTCGATLLDYSTGQAHIEHPMLGGLKFTSNTPRIYVTVKDSDLNGTSYDVIDVINTTVTITPSANVTVATGVEVNLTNIVRLRLKVIAWCAPGYSGPNCLPPGGKITCLTGYTGINCDQSITPCDPSPCQHGGSCTQTRNRSFNCTCQTGFQGSTCAQDTNECLLGVCQNGGTCHNLVGNFSCSCPEGWTGLICTESVPECTPSPCVHGTCLPGMSAAHRCKCKPGWTGTTCSTDINECSNSLCKHGGTCVNFDGGFSCTFPKGFNGSLCQTNINDCDSTFCLNNGQCVDGINSYACTCLPGYTGSTCEQRSDVCSSVTCEHNSRCEWKFSDFQCDCPKGWTGKICNVDVNECIHSPCLNVGKCTNTPGQYSCACQGGWLGVNCEARDGRNILYSGKLCACTCTNKVDTRHNHCYTITVSKIRSNIDKFIGPSMLLTFGSKITASVQDSVISGIYSAVTSHICQGQQALVVRSISDRKLVITYRCDNITIPVNNLNRALSSVQLPLTFVNVTSQTARQVVSRNNHNTKSYGGIVGGCIGGAVFIALIVAMLIFIRRRQGVKESDGFANPSFALEQTNRS